METLHVDLDKKGYNIYIDSGTLNNAGRIVRDNLRGNSVTIISNMQIAEKYLKTLKKSLENESILCNSIIIKAGERYKTLKSIQQIYTEMISQGLDRHSCVISLGGGVIGDMAGFAASTYLRGIDFIQIPTTLLAQVDASVGGKVGVDLPEGKNLVGAFYQPKAVIIDVDTLKSLPKREIACGMAEIIKHGFIRDEKLLEYLESHVKEIQKNDPKILIELVKWNCKIKASVVEKDEKESGLRAILNYGHTVGHAFEAISGYGKYHHGEAVALGMVAAGEIARLTGRIGKEICERQKKILSLYGLPIKAKERINIDAVIDTLKHDKKCIGGKIRFVLLKGIGDTDIVDNIDIAMVKDTISRELFSD